MTKRFRGLSARQQDVFEAIATGHDSPPAARSLLDALERKGFIAYETVPMYGPTNAPIDRIPMMVRSYYVPLPIHAEWCEWCSDQESVHE